MEVISPYVFPGLYKPHELKFEDLITVVCDELHLAKSELLSKSRKAKLVEGRQIIIYCATTILKMSSNSIGVNLGFDHSTILHHVKVIKGFLDYEPEMREKVRRMKDTLQKMKLNLY